MTRTYWLVGKDGEVLSGPLAYVDAEAVVDTLGEGYELRYLDDLRSYPLGNYITPGTVAYREHHRAATAGSGPARATRLLADACYELATRVGPRGDLYLGPIVRELLEQLIALGGHDYGGWDPGTVDAWARYVAEFITEPLP